MIYGHLDSPELRKHQLPVPVAKETVKPMGDICAAAEPSADGAPTNKQPADFCPVLAMKRMSLELKNPLFRVWLNLGGGFKSRTPPKCNCSVANSADEMTGKKSGVSKMGVGRMDDFCMGSKLLNKWPFRKDQILVTSSDL